MRPLALCFLVVGCALDVVFPVDRAPGESGDSADSGDSGDTAPRARFATTPVAPSATRPMWQGLQEAHLDADGAPCAAPIAAAMSMDAFCFVAAGDELWCAGRVYTEDFGPSFVPTGLTGVRQVLLSATADAENGNAMCALADGVLQCFGYRNTLGQLATGSTEPNETFLPWGAVTGVVGTATGSWSQLCVLDGAGEAWCAGSGYGVEPTSLGSGHTALIIGSDGAPSFDDPTRWRASAGMSQCFVTAAGLECDEPLGEMGIQGVLGEPGHVVDGGLRQTEPRDACWLDDGGRAWCGDPSAAERVFVDQPVLLLAVDFYTDAMCAIYADGSVACRGEHNTTGKLGAGSTVPLFVDTVVAPPGTVDTACR